jgi:hypothetical protein
MKNKTIKLSGIVVGILFVCLVFMPMAATAISSEEYPARRDF